ncbi:hypothetical protein JD844_030873 [Phrynosoma platyrhinos]|uniref:RNA helicase n=1 Tax=Phrynosoma platyrhinos TaxID=52577 RepID=A0ABQ7T121_PHRPL|nr:hypothetical protein JD844_030873 [Phrynosoma platyrhinos]
MAAVAARDGSFSQLGLDPRLLQSVAALGWRRPTLIQAEAIPLALEGKDVLARARTGSGKTGAFALPLLHRILRSKDALASSSSVAVRGLVLVPTRELGQQATQMLRRLSASPILMEKPDVVVGTPSRVLAHLQAGNLSLQESLEILVMDEADLLFSFGFEEDLKSKGELECLKGKSCTGIALEELGCDMRTPCLSLHHRWQRSSQLPKIYQTFIMSATFNNDVQALKELVLHNPVILKLQESQLPDSSQLSQFQIQCETEEDKFLLLYVLLKLLLVRGKLILFVGTIERSYRLKLFLEQFSIPACVLNSELPVKSRCHIISQFNKGFYDYIIATDEQDLADPEGPREGKRRRKSSSKGTRGEKSRDQEYGVSRGIDFQNVSAVLNFDVPLSVESYIHRAGRTARADNPGTVLTFVSPSERPLLVTIESALTGDTGETPLRPYQFRMEEVEGLRYRCQDAMRSVTKQAIKEARLREIKEELLNSEKLKTYFEDNPRDWDLLRHDKPLHPAVIKPHLRNVPEYLMPPTLRAVARPFLGKHKHQKRFPPHSNKGQKNPLRSFSSAKQRQWTSATKSKAAPGTSDP